MIFTIPDGPFDSDKWDVVKKPPRNVDPFNGTTSTYRTWNARVKEHVMGKQPGWMRVIQLIEAEPKPYTNVMIKTFDEIDGKPVDCAWLSNHLWSLICSNVTNDVFTHRVAFAGAKKISASNCGAGDSNIVKEARKR